MGRIICGDALETLRTMDAESVQCVVTSPPYWGLRDYGIAGQLGLERTPEEYVAHMVEVFREVRRVLRTDGTLWLNLGDSYASAWARKRRNVVGKGSPDADVERGRVGDGLKEKDLCGIPWRLAFALQADGWYLRSDIIWHKPNPMPESVTDRPTKAHEYLFLLAKSKRYYYDAEAIKESATEPAKRCGKNSRANVGRDLAHGTAKQDAIGLRRYVGFNRRYDFENPPNDRNARSVWTVATAHFSGAHFATFPEALVEPCIRAGTKPGDTVLDPFMGAGTVGLVAVRLGREYLGIELNPKYVEMAERRLRDKVRLFVGAIDARG